jgi:hypothetical protein
MSDDLWPEPRGPHLPDTLMRIPLGVWPFLALAVLALYGQWDELRSVASLHPIDIAFTIAASLGAVVSPLLGAALFWRHPEAHRTLPAVTFGVVLFAASTVVNTLRDPVLEAIRQLDPEMSPIGPAVIGYQLVQALVIAFAATYLALGLADARRFEDRGDHRVWRALLVLAAVAAPAVTAVVWLPLPTVVELVVISLLTQLVTGLAWAFLAWTTLRGWVAGEEPNRAWALAVAAPIAQLAFGLIVAALNVLIYGFIGATEAPSALAFNVYRLFDLVVLASWLALLAAFWLGLPAELAATEGDVDTDAVADAPGPA